MLAGDETYRSSISKEAQIGKVVVDGKPESLGVFMCTIEFLCCWNRFRKVCIT